MTDPHSGIITTRQSLDRERKDSYTLVLLVTDRGEPPQQSTRIVTVIVTDVDDHKPHFGRNLVREIATVDITRTNHMIANKMFYYTHVDFCWLLCYPINNYE